MNTFEVTSGALRVTDPCYDMDTWCAGTIANVKNGTWAAGIVTSDEDSWGVRVSRLCIKHVDVVEKGSDYARTDIDVGVDSGQAGFFDLTPFTEHAAATHGDDSENHKSFYDEVCKMTIDENQFGVVEFGAVSRSGFGDGSYDCYTAINAEGQVVAAYIDFITEDEEDEDDEENDDDC